MAAVLVLAGVKGYQKYQERKAKSSAGGESKSRKNRKGISNLVIPSVASANIVPGHEEYADEVPPPQYELYQKEASLETPSHSVPYSPDSAEVTNRSAPTAPVMLGITLCESPVTPTSDFDDDSPLPSRNSGRNQVFSQEVFELPTEDPFLEPASPAPLNIVKRSSAPLPQLHEQPDMTYSSDDNEDFEDRHHARKRSNYLEVPKSATDLLSFQPPPIPPKSPARKLRASEF